MNNLRKPIDRNQHKNAHIMFVLFPNIAALWITRSNSESYNVSSARFLRLLSVVYLSMTAICHWLNTFVLKRKNPIPLHKKGGRPSKMRGRHFVYDLVEDTNVTKKPDVKVILSQFIDGVGNEGDILTLRPTQAYRDYLIPGLAVYASPENQEKYKAYANKPKTEDTFSSPYVHRTIGCLSRTILQITMNKMEPWVLEPWHVSASFRKSGFIVPEHVIEMPPVQIKGPDLSLQDKEFYVTVTINKTEKVNVRCRIHHWATGVDRLPWEEFHWKKPKEPLIPEQAAELEKMSQPQ